MKASESVTELLVRWGNGDHAALDSLIPIVYSELRRVARAYLQRERPNHTLQPTALVNEAYLRVIDQKTVRWQNRAQFYGIAAQLMRRILVDHVRQHQAAKRGGSDQERLSITSTDRHVAKQRASEPAIDLLALHEALSELETIDPQQARIVEREWKMARAWLRRKLQ
jgi:RNA polymerase sigma factor (TIGR02999 family)